MCNIDEVLQSIAFLELRNNKLRTFRNLDIERYVFTKDDYEYIYNPVNYILTNEYEKPWLLYTWKNSSL